MIIPWQVSTENEYAYASVAGLVNITIKQDAEGIVIDVWNNDSTEIIDSMTVWNEDMEGDE